MGKPKKLVWKCFEKIDKVVISANLVTSVKGVTQEVFIVILLALFTTFPIEKH
jgi:hypothetical protein